EDEVKVDCPNSVSAISTCADDPTAALCILRARERDCSARGRCSGGSAPQEFCTTGNLPEGGATTCCAACVMVVDRTISPRQPAPGEDACYAPAPGGDGSDCEREGGDICPRSIDDPLIIDFGHRGFSLTNVKDGVEFDLDADGELEHTAWTRAGAADAFL